MQRQSEVFFDLCRTCATVTVHGSRHYIFGDDGLTNKIAEKLNSLSVDVSSDDQLPKVMCGECVYKLGIVNEFIDKIKNTHIQLGRMLDEMSGNIKAEPYDYNFQAREADENTEASAPTAEPLFYNVKEEPVALAECFTSELHEEENSENSSDCRNSGSISYQQAINLCTVRKELNHEYDHSRATTNGYQCPYCHFLFPSAEAATAHFAQVHNISITPLASTSSHPPPEAREQNLKSRKQKLTRHRRDTPSLPKGIPATGNNNESSSSSSDFTSQHQKNDKIKVNKRKIAAPVTDNPSSSNEQPQDESQQTQTICKKPFIRSEFDNCQFCYIAFPSAEKLSCHMVENHKQEYECKMCFSQFKSQDDFEKHLKTNPGNHYWPKASNWTCSECDKKFERRKRCSVKAHLRRHTGERPFPCSLCSKSFFTKTSLQMHVRIHKKAFSDICNYCGKGFYNTACLNAHIRCAHTNERPFKCDKCSECFPTTTMLNAHISKKHDENPKKIFECEVCYRKFENNNSFNYHKKTHQASLDERKIHKCLECNVSFVRKAYLTNHLKIHSGESLEKYECNVCGKKLGTSGGLELHLKNHAGVKNFVCDVCGKAFASMGLLRLHILSHTGEKPHRCRVCGKQFTQRTSLVIHLKNLHNLDGRVRILKKQ